MTAWLRRSTDARRGLERFAEGVWAAPVIFMLALGVYGIVAVAWPLAAGRDLGTYLRASFELRATEVVLPQALLMRAPVTGVVSEALLSAGPLAAELAMAALYALSIVCWWSVARRMGPRAGLATVVLLLVFPGYALLFHRLSSDAVYAIAFALGALLVARAIETPTAARSAALGAGLALLVLVRPVSQMLVVLAPLLLFLPGTWRIRLGRVAVLALAMALPLAGWAAHNAIRADDLTVVRGAGHGLPLFRAFVTDRIVEPANGPASRELAAAVARDLLPLEPYRSYGIEVDDFFASGSARMHEDLIVLADRTWGWDDDYRHLAQVGREAVRSHPGAYTRGVARDVWRLLWWPLFLPVAAGGDAPGSPAAAVIVVDGRELPRSSEGQPIPGARESAWISTPDRSIREVWSSPTEHGIVFRDPAGARHLEALERRLTHLFGSFPERSGSATLGERLNSASRWFPRSIVWLAFGLVAMLARRPARAATPLVLAGAALLLLVATSLAVPATAEYSTPLAPAFVVLASAGLLAPKARTGRGGPA